MDEDVGRMTGRLEQLFAVQAAATPEAPAIICRGQVTRYATLSERVDQLAGELARYGVRPGVLVAVCLRRTPGMVAALIATLRTGGAYLPLDARTPPERMAFMLSDSGASVLLTDGASPVPEGFGGTVLELTKTHLVQRAYAARMPATLPEELAYVIYTSGSTGQPKGVMLGHGAAHLVDWARQAYSDEERSCIAATTSLSFDPSVFEIFVPLCTGGALVLKENALQPFTEDERPTMLDTVPAVLAELCRAKAIPQSVQVLNVGGEVLKSELVREVFRGDSHLTLYNHYGPTEATTCTTVARVSRDLVGDPPIGRPVRGAQVVLLDACGRVVGEDEEGDIHIGGPGLALGYLNRPDLTAARFISGPGGRLYRTGDIGAWRGGELHFAGRRDRQVKVRGVRIELGEIEAAAMRIVQVERALATVREAGGRSQIVLYVQSPQRLTPVVARETLAGWLPESMLPAHIVILEAFPLLASGKIDRSALPGPDRPASASPDEVTRMERPIVHVFQEVLGRACVSPENSFFDLGGDSLSSLRAALRLEEVLGYEVPAALIHQAPTPRALARSLEHGRVRAEGHLSLLQPGGTKPPLFCMADLFGHAFNYLSLARRLGTDRPIYGVVPGALQETFTREGDVSRLTESFKAELRGIQPHGPYHIAGYSAGGILAFDLACALEREGEAVKLILLDARLHSGAPSAAVVARWASRQAGALGDPRKLAMRIRGAGARLRERTRASAARKPPNWLPRTQVAFAASLIKAGASYRPETFAGPTLMVIAGGHDPSGEDRLLGWSGALKGDVVQALVPGGHHQFMREPSVVETVHAVQRFLLGPD